MLSGLRLLISPAPSFSLVSNDVLRQMVESIPDKEAVDSRRRLFDLLDDAHKFAVPEWMTNRELAVIWREVEADRRAGIFDPEDAGKTDIELKAEYRAIAERRVRLGLVVGEIAKRNHIAVDREDIAFARAHGYRGPNSAILEEKVVEFIFGLPHTST